MTLREWLSVLRPGFPRLTAENSRLTSPADEDYNCIAWAAGNTERWWWPDPNLQSYWPPGVPRVETIDAFVQAYALQGYTERADATVETGKQKIAIFATDDGRPKHASRQLVDGWWASKLGPSIDIEHELVAIEGPAYGKVGIVLARMTASVS